MVRTPRRKPVFRRWRPKSWFGLVVSSKTPAPITERLQRAIVTAQKDPAYLEKLVRQGGERPACLVPKLIKTDAAKWSAVIKAAGIKPE
jgi:tripartite-type tricarboxylate transporter receptor subunit TctC